MSSNSIQFSVDEVRHLAHNGYAISGRCELGPFDVGDTFDKVLDFLMQKPPNEHEIAETHVVETVSLRVDRICSYHHEFERLEQGMTAELFLSGSGGDKLKVGHSIGGVRSDQCSSSSGVPARES